MPRLAIVTCLKNEGDDLVEWLCFHRQIGVSRFVIYDNLSTDATARILKAVPFKNEITVHRIAEETAQKVAFSDAIKRYRSELDWAAFIDGDEFIVPLGKVSLLEKLAEFEAQGVSGFGIHWRIFGSSHLQERPDGLLTESFTHRAKDGFKPNRHVKSILRMPAVRAMVTQHYFPVSGGRYLLDNGAEPPPDFEGVISEKPTFTHGFALHHYITKSRAQCMRKIARGRPRPSSSPAKYRPQSYFERYDRNELEDHKAVSIIAPIREEVLRLRDSIGRV